jgi:glutathione S-transferase
VHAKGTAIALALDHAGLEWEGVFIKPGGTMEELLANWGELKPTTPFGELPILTTPDAGVIGHELAILNYIGRKTALGGTGDKEFAASAQLMQMSEDIYSKLTKIQPTMFDPKTDIVAAGTTAEFWNDTDTVKHNYAQGLAAYLSYLETFHGSCGAGAGKYTSSGVTVGECKLFASLSMLTLIKPDCLNAYPAVKAFFDVFGALPATKGVLETGSQMPGPFAQYFMTHSYFAVSDTPKASRVFEVGVSTCRNPL